MPRAHEQVGHFVSAHRPDVVVYDVGVPYESSWHLLEAIRMANASSQPIVMTTPNKAQLEQAVGRTGALEITGRKRDLRRVLRAVDEAADAARQRQVRSVSQRPPLAAAMAILYTDTVCARVAEAGL